MTIRQRALGTALAAILAASPVSGAAAGCTPAAATAAFDATPAPVAAVVPDDLAHLTFTATGPLAARFVSPVDGEGASAATMFEVATVSGAGVELCVGGRIVPPERIGKRTIDRRTGETHYFFYGVALASGPNAVSLVSLGAAGARGPAVLATVYGPGPAQSVRTKLVGSLVADGRNVAFLHVTFLDAWGHASQAGEGVAASVTSGDATLGDPRVLAATQNATPPPNDYGQQLRTARRYTDRTDGSGSIDVPVVAGLRAGRIAIAIVSESGIAGDAVVVSKPNLRAPIVTGLVTGGVGAVPGIPGQSLGVVDGADSRRARIALFGTGAIWGDASLSFAYDTATTLDESIGYGPFISNPDERPYLTYGDESSRRDDALSRGHLYARVERDTSSFMWGRFQATTGSGFPGSLGGLDLLVSGAKLETGTQNVRVTAFHATDDFAYGRQTFSPTGLATLSVPLHPDILVGSDVVEIVSLDRHTGAVVSGRSLVRDVDYVLDDATGQLRFIDPPMPFDVFFNPQQILVRYEYRGVGSEAVTTGGRVATTFGKGDAYLAGAGYVNDAQGAGNVSLFSQNLRGPLPGGTWTLEHVATRGQAGDEDPLVTQTTDGGDAYRSTIDSLSRFGKLSLAYEQTTAGYDNPFGGLTTPGLASFRGDFGRPLLGGTLDLAVDRERNVGVGYSNAIANAQIAVKRTFGRRLTVAAGLARHDYSAGSTFVAPPNASQDLNAVATPVPQATSLALAYANPTGSVTQGSLGLAYRLSNAIDVSVSKLANLAGTTDATAASPSQTQAELGVTFGTKGRAYVRQMWNGAPTESFAASSVPLTAQTSGTSSTTFGFERTLGPATTVDSQYVVENAGNATDIYSSIGVREKIAVAKRLTGSVGVQRADAVGTGLSGFDVYDATLAYKASDRFRATSAYQLRTGNTAGSTLALGAAGNLASGFSIIASLNDANVSGYRSDRDRVSLAIRPASDDRSITLLGYERDAGNQSEVGEHTELLSLEHEWRPRRTTEISARLAYKLDGGPYYAAHTSLLGLRADERLGGPDGRLDVAAEARRLAPGAGTAAAGSTGVALETGVTIGASMRAAVGYDFFSNPDPSLASGPRRKGIYATLTSAIDSLFGWGGR